MIAPVAIAHCPICHQPGQLCDRCRAAMQLAMDVLIEKGRFNTRNMLEAMRRYQATLSPSWVCQKCGTEYTFAPAWCAECGFDGRQDQ